MAVLDLPPLLLAYGAAAVFAAAFVRGFSGFGSSMIWISSLTLILPPREVVPMVLLFEVAASLALLPGVWREIHWRSLRWILAGTALATPFGVYLLVVLAADAVRIGIAVVVLAAVALIWRGTRFDLPKGPLPAIGTGLGAGLLNGATGVGGPPVVLFYFGSTAHVAVGRATIIAYFLFSDVFGSGVMAGEGLVTETVLWRFGLGLPIIGLGLWAGNRRFRKTPSVTFKHAVLILMAALALGLMLRVAIG